MPHSLHGSMRRAAEPASGIVKGGKLRVERKPRAFRKRTLALLAAFTVACGYAAWASAPPSSSPLGSVNAVSALTRVEAASGLPADFEATVSYFRSYERTLFVEDGGAAIYVNAATSLPLVAGDRVRIRGTTAIGFRPFVTSDNIVLISHGPAPKAIPSTFEDLISARRDSLTVSVQGVAHTADLVERGDVRGKNLPMHTSARIQVLTDGGYVEAMVDTGDAQAVKNLLDAEVTVTGVAAGSFDGKYHQTGNQLYVSSLDGIKVMRRAAANPWSLPVTPMDRIIGSLHERDLSNRVRVHGVITYYMPGAAVVLEDGPESLWISTQTRDPLQVGDVADAIGFPNSRSKLLSLEYAEIQDLNVRAPVQPRPVDWAELASSRRVYDLVSIQGKVVTAVREAAQDEYVLVADGQLFSAILRHQLSSNQSPQALPPTPQIPAGSTVRVTGVCIPEDSNPFSTNVPFNLLMRSADDIKVISKPDWLNVRHLTMLIGWLVFLVLAVGVRVWFVERKVRRQIAGLAYVERRRGKILEDINNSRPLAEILERITELVSARLNGAPCWCQIVDGARLGNSPAELSASDLRIVEKPIPSRSGPPHGTLYTAFDSYTKPDPVEMDALTMAAGLATLAVETSRLYSDLVHRSEFDQLTDIQNRFSLERYLENLIPAARQSAGIFGLLYVDLNEFKQVNDVYGHRAGDLYLQEVALRMKRQLRPGDMLARLGGDEFAVLVPNVRSRADVEEIALRLECCFEPPFVGDGFAIHGSASIGIALYPEDGTTKDSLLSASDAAMYVTKQTRPNRGDAPKRQPDRELTPKNRG
jgi:diguanylate cyclase (GGDEF)-like protein